MKGIKMDNEKKDFPEHEHCWHDVKVNHFYGSWQVCCKCSEWRRKPLEWKKKPLRVDDPMDLMVIDCNRLG